MADNHFTKSDLAKRCNTTKDDIGRRVGLGQIPKPNVPHSSGRGLYTPALADAVVELMAIITNNGGVYDEREIPMKLRDLLNEKKDPEKDGRECFRLRIECGCKAKPKMADLRGARTEHVDRFVKSLNKIGWRYRSLSWRCPTCIQRRASAVGDS